MTYVDQIVAKFGGIRPMARTCELPVPTVHAWKRRGVIPARRQAELLQIAARKGIALAPADFFPPDIVAAE